ncbi:TPA: Shedu anti-phage system protein SduA domain-containing protein [Vibrio cholerae]
MFQNWEYLNSNRDIIEHLKEQWLSMLDNENLKEEGYHRFLAEHAGMFFSHISNCFTCVSKLNLGDDFQTDFVVPRDSGSYGFSYELIEIESPHVSAFNKSGCVSSRLNRAIQQISDWEHWIRQNQELAKRLFPSKSFYLWNEPRFSYTIYISRRSELESVDHLRHRYEKAHKVRIRSFDHLTDQMCKQMFMNETMLYSAEEDKLEKLTRNKLVNPFSSAISGKQWKDISSSKSFSYAHSFALSSELFLKYKVHSSLYEKFKNAS